MEMEKRTGIRSNGPMTDDMDRNKATDSGEKNNGGVSHFGECAKKSLGSTDKVFTR